MTDSRGAGADPAWARLAPRLPELEKNLLQNVIPFWFPRSLDRARGGYHLHFGAQGQALAGGVKAIVSQARTLWLASRLRRSRYTQPGLAEAADHGFRFLRDRLWDGEHGGFFWEVDPSGRQPLRDHKHVYGQAFGIYALCEHFQASGDREALDLAVRLFELLESRAHDPLHGGYREFFTRDWREPAADQRPYVGEAAGEKLMNTHLHLLEAFTALLLASALPRVRERLCELVAILSHAVVRTAWGACSDRHRRDWTPILAGKAARVSYGHDLENIWLLAAALAALGRPTAPYHELFRSLFASSRRHGYDESAGGFFESGPPGQPADRRAKPWWVQAEALVCALAMYELTRDADPLDVFERTWELVDTKLTDWTHGEWFEAIDPTGRPAGGPKAHPWKVGYHNGRALLESLERIQALARRSA